MPRGWIAAIVAVVAVLTTRRADAQACCSTTGSEEFGIVNRISSGIVAAQISATHALGSFDARGNHRPIEGAVDDASLVIGAGARLWPRSLQIHGSVPFRLQRRDLSGLPASTSAGVGDAVVALRWTAVSDRIEPWSSDPTTWLPYVDLYGGVRLPTGRPPEDSDESSGSDVTGDGAWTPFGGGQQSFDAGDVITLRAGWIYLHDLFLSGGPFAELELAGSAEQDGRSVADSDARRVRFGAHVSWVFDYPNWEAVLNASSDAFWDGASKNVPFAGPSVGLTISRHFP